MITPFCSKCGAELPADSQFCPKCGQPVGQSAGQAEGPGPFDYMSRRDWRHMRRAERHQLRHEWHASPERALFEAIFGGLMVIFVGVLLFLAASGEGGELVSWSNFWVYLIPGIGIMLVIRGFFEMLMRHYEGWDTLFGGLIVTLLGGLLYLAYTGVAGDLVSWSNFWIYLLLGLGIMLLARGVYELISRRYHGTGMIIGGVALLVIGAAGLTVSLGGLTRYLWIAIIVVCGLLIILGGLLTYLFKK